MRGVTKRGKKWIARDTSSNFLGQSLNKAEAEGMRHQWELDNHYIFIEKSWESSYETFNKLFYVDGQHRLRYKNNSINRVKDSLAGHSNGNGYLRVNLPFGNEYEHRILYTLYNKRLPEFNVDHVDGNRLNNSPENLRDVPAHINSRNASLRCNNKTGINGVSWNKNIGKWEVYINTSPNVRKHLGITDDFFEACCLRKRQDIPNDYHENHGREK